MTSEINNIETDIGIALSIILMTLGIISKSPALLKLIDGCANKIMCIPTMFRIIHLKLRQPVEIVQEIDRQDNAAVLEKLGVPYDIVAGLYELAPGEDGTINEEVVGALIRAINLMKKNQCNKFTPLEMKK